MKGFAMIESGLPDRDHREALSAMCIIQSEGTACFGDALVRKGHGWCGGEDREIWIEMRGDLKVRVSSSLLGDGEGLDGSLCS